MENRILQLMTALKISREEALQVLEDDKRIDRGEKLFELTEEQKAVEKKMRQAPRTANAKPPKRERKTDNDKRFLIDSLVWALTTEVENAGDNVLAQNVEIVNPEREFLFTYNGKKYKVVLSAPRT
jgi:hypothetical protein